MNNVELYLFSLAFLEASIFYIDQEPTVSVKYANFGANFFLGGSRDAMEVILTLRNSKCRQLQEES